MLLTPKYWTHYCRGQPILWKIIITCISVAAASNIIFECSHHYWSDHRDDMETNLSRGSGDHYCLVLGTLQRETRELSQRHVSTTCHNTWREGERGGKRPKHAASVLRKETTNNHNFSCLVTKCCEMKRWWGDAWGRWNIVLLVPSWWWRWWIIPNESLTHI